MKYLFSFMTSIDFLGTGLNLTVNSNDQFKTVLGGFFSLCIYIAYLYFFIEFGDNFIKKINPSGYSQLIPSGGHTNALNITEELLLVGFQIYDNDGVVLRIEDYLHPVFTLREMTNVDGEFKSKRTPLKAVPCSNVKNLSQNMDTSIFNMTKFYCPDFSELKNKTIQGDFSSAKANMLEFYLSFCEIGNKNCKNLTKIKELTKGKKKWISTIIPHVEYDINNYESAFSVSLKNYYNLITPYKYIYEEFTFSRYNSDSDVGYWFSDIRKEEGIGLESTISYEQPIIDLIKNEEITEDIDYNDLAIYKGQILFQNHELYFSRWYLKLPDIIANVAATLDLIIFLIAFLYSFYSKFSLDKYLCNRLLLIEEEPRNLHKIFVEINNIQLSKDKNISNNIQKEKSFDKSDISQRRLQEIPLEDLNPDNKKIEELPNDQGSEREIIKKNAKEILTKNVKSFIEKLKNPSEFFNINYPNYILSCISNESKQKTEIIDKFSEKIYEILDINNFLKLSNKIKLFEKIFFSKNQKKIIKLFAKKNFKICLKEKKEDKKEESENLNVEGIVDLLLKSHFEELDEKDKKISELFLN